MTEDNANKLALAISHEEGFFAPVIVGAPNRPQRNHNPGDLRDWPGYPADEGGFSIFPDDATGWEKLKLNLTNHAARNPQQTISEYIGGDGKGWPGYAPASDGNDPVAYAEAVAREMGVTPETRFEEL